MDKTIRFWNTLTGQPLHHVDTGSQVPNFTQSSFFIFFCQHVVSMIAMDLWLNGQVSLGSKGFLCGSFVGVSGGRQDSN